MGKITIDEMHNSLFNYAQAVSDESLMTESKTIVGAINEIYGKQLIADSVGEPLSNTDTYSKMSNDINNLLSTFKTNMMNAGVVVESGDKFKQLIDKIATMVEEGEGKGIQYASGITSNNFSNVQIDGVDFTCLNISLNFKPTILIVRNHGNYGFYIEDFYPDNFNIVTVDNGYDEYRNVKNYEIDKGNNNYSIPIGYTIQEDTTYYWAVGVGEEDTTLRDSLASILEDEGVSVSDEDDMASLISKVDEEFDRKNANTGLDIISATELPATGKENQICVITDNPVDNYLITTCASEKLDVGITLYLDNTASVDPMTGVSLPITTGNLTTNYHFSTVYQNDNRLPSYYYSNNTWNELTLAYIALVENGVVNKNTIAGDFSLGSSGWASMSNPVQSVYCSPDYDNYYANSFANKINFGNYSKITVRCFEDGAVIPDLIVFASTTKHTRESVSTLYAIYIDSQKVTGGWATSTIITFDISSWTGEYYLSLAGGKSGSSIYIEDIFLY